MSNIYYDVEVIKQEQNPICWIASCAMVKGWGTQSGVGVGEFTDGFDPSNSCISNLAGDWQQCTDLMSDWGFDVLTIDEISSGSITGDELVAALSERGPAVLLHLCDGFPYGSQYVPMTSGAHAVVITGADTDNGQFYFNNPWGDKDQSASLDDILQHMKADSVKEGKTLGFWPLNLN